MRILVVDDNAALSDLLCRVLRESGYRADALSTVESALAQLDRERYDAVVLDMRLPDGSGLAVVRELRERGDWTPILCLSGDGDDHSTIEALDAGADDFALKPIALGIFRARVRALTRRGQRVRSASLLQLGNVQLDRIAHTMTCDGKTVATTRKELSLLEYFMLRPGALVTRSELLHDVWGLDFETGTNLIDVHISRMRRLVRHAGCSLEFITLRGQGFVLRPREHPTPA